MDVTTLEKNNIGKKEKKKLSKIKNKEFKNITKKYDYSQEEVHAEWGVQENDVRPNWTSRSHFILTTFGFVVGTGNLFAFPNECRKYGGLVYIGMYIVVFVVLGMPLMLLELALGQYTSQGPVTCWKMASLFKGKKIKCYSVVF